MKTLYIECNMGAAGDMLMASLLELHPDPDGFLTRLNSIGIPDVTVTKEKSIKCGISGTHIRVLVGQSEESEEGLKTIHQHEHDHEHNHNHEHEHNHEHSHEHSHEHEHNHEHSHNSYSSTKQIINNLDLSDSVKENTLAVYNVIAEAESFVHGVQINQIHFHEVGNMDAIADIVGVVMLIEEIAPARILASPINTGSGFVKCAHGILPVPAPATAYILKDIPIYSDGTKTELCTPTGAAILKHFVQEFCSMPVMTISSIGYGMGKKDLEKANCVRLFLGETESSYTEEVVELACNLDDMTPEAIAFASQQLLTAGALDVYTTSIGMKKGRMGIMFTVMCHLNDREKLLPIIFKHTSTIGVREHTFKRYILNREVKNRKTPYGKVRIKTSNGYGITKEKAEYDDISKIAKENNLSLSEVNLIVQNNNL